jgi:hypothetical protein
LLLVSGTDDEIVTAAEVAGLRDLLVARGLTDVQAATLRMAHALIAEPGMDPQPPTAEAVSVDHALTDWFRDRLAVPPASGARPASAHEAMHEAMPLTGAMSLNMFAARPPASREPTSPSTPGSTTPKVHAATWTEAPPLGSHASL